MKKSIYYYKLLQSDTTRRAIERECNSYNSGCIRLDHGIKKICPLKGRLNLCNIELADSDDIETAYHIMFPDEDAIT